MKFLQFLVIFFAIFFLVRLIFRALLPGLVRMAIRKMGYKFSQQYQEPPRPAPTQEGDLRVEYVPPKKKENISVSPKSGEFVEYEEVKAKKE